MYDGIFPYSRSRSQVSGSCQIWPHARSIGSDRVNGSEWKFPYRGCMGPCPVYNGAAVLISSHGLGHVAPNLEYSTKSVKC